MLTLKKIYFQDPYMNGSFLCNQFNLHKGTVDIKPISGVVYFPKINFVDFIQLQKIKDRRNCKIVLPCDSIDSHCLFILVATCLKVGPCCTRIDFKLFYSS